MLTLHDVLSYLLLALYYGSAVYGSIIPRELNSSHQALDFQAAKDTPPNAQKCSSAEFQDWSNATLLGDIPVLNISSPATSASGSSSSSDNLPNAILTEKRKLIWRANFNERTHTIRSPAFNLVKIDKGVPKYRLRFDSTQSIVVTQYTKKSDDTAYHARLLTDTGGQEHGCWDYVANEDSRIMYDLEVPDMPEESIIAGRVEWLEVTEDDAVGGSLEPSR